MVTTTTVTTMAKMTTTRALRPRVRLLALVVVTLVLLTLGPSGCEAKKKKKMKGVKTEKKPLPLHSPDQTQEETLELETPKVGAGGVRACIMYNWREGTCCTEARISPRCTLGVSDAEVCVWGEGLDGGMEGGFEEQNRVGKKLRSMRDQLNP